MTPTRNTPVSTQTATNASKQLTLSNLSNAVEVRLKQEKFLGAFGHNIDFTIFNFRICPNNHILSNDERSLLVLSRLKGGALEFCLKEINSQRPRQMVVDKLCARYSTQHRKLPLQSEVDSLNYDDFMARHQIQYEKEFLRRTVEYLNNNTTQLVDGFHTESNKTRFLLNAVLGMKCATSLLKNISTTQYYFDKLLVALNERLQFETEIHKTNTFSKTYNGQFTTHPKDARKYHLSHKSD